MIRPPSLPPAALDRLLARGWYRMRQAMFTCRFMLRETGVYSVAWTRLPLAAHEPRRSHRRRLEKARRELRFEVGPLRLDAEREALYARYLEHVGGDRAASLRETLFDEPVDPATLPVTMGPLDADGAPDPLGIGLFDTLELAVRTPRGELVALSVFDRGERALQSIIGVYDPAYARLGLGMATLLAEIEWGQAQGYDHHYSGYVVPGVSDFEYKREAGALEFLDDDPRAGTGSWLPIASLDPDRLPARRLHRRLDAVAEGLRAAEVPHRLRLHPPYRFVQLNRLAATALGEPLFLEVGDAAGPMRLGVSYDVAEDVFHLDVYTRGRDLSRLFVDVEARGPLDPELRLLTRVASVGAEDSPERMAALVKAVWRRGA